MNHPLRTDRLLEAIAREFPGLRALPDSFIEGNPDLACLRQPPDLQAVVPAYMAWCVRNAAEVNTLIPDYTVAALAEFGRSKNPAIAHLNFKHTCSPEQRVVVADFLRWCLNPDLVLHTEQIERSLKHWSPESGK
jgi:hypothetical protein